ncbi:MAG: GNAT family protein [Candidatus Cybelea sp.]
MTLVPFSSEHFATLASWFPTERDVLQWAGPRVRFPIDKAQFVAMIDEGLTNPPTRLCWMAKLREELVGHSQLHFDWRNRSATLSRVAIAPALRGHGLAVPMLRRVIDKAFALPDIERLELNVYSFNIPAVRTYERLGFAIEGVSRASARAGSERWDTIQMAILKQHLTTR